MMRIFSDKTKCFNGFITNPQNKIVLKNSSLMHVLITAKEYLIKVSAI